MLNLVNFIGVLVYLWSVDEKNHFLQTDLQKTFVCKSKCRLFVESNHNLQSILIQSNTPDECCVL